MPRILAVADEVAESLGGEALAQLRPDLVLSAGDLPFDYLEYLVTVLNVPLRMPPVVSKNVSRSRMIACGGNCSLCVVAAGCFLMAVPIARTSTKLEPISWM